VELYVFQFRPENVHLATIFKNDLIVQVLKCLFSLSCFIILHKCFPDFCLFEDENLDDCAMRTEKLIEIVMGDYITKLVVDADQQHWALGCMVLM